jgi:hypothetical protein
MPSAGAWAWDLYLDQDRDDKVDGNEICPSSSFKHKHTTTVSTHYVLYSSRSTYMGIYNPLTNTETKTPTPDGLSGNSNSIRPIPLLHGK